LLACFVFIIWLFRVDISQRRLASSALWIPGLWVAVIGTRPVSYWFVLSGIGTMGTGEATETHPANTATYFLLIVSAAITLVRRHVSGATVFRNNKALLLLYAYFALASFWAPDGLVSFKRLFKDFGNVLIVLVILTEPNPWHNARTLFVRISYFFLPLSLVLAKYFPYIGRNASRDGNTMYTGLTTQKNTLGEVTMLCMLFILWDYVEIGKELPTAKAKAARRVRIVMLLIGCYELSLAQSTTAILCTIVAVAFFLLFKRILAHKKGRAVIRVGLVAAVFAVALEKTFDLSTSILLYFGKSPNLTGRTDVWEEAIRLQDRPVLGFGFYQFWDTSKATQLYENLGDLIPIKTVHNGYIEMYLDGGFVGLGLFAIFLLTFLRRGYKDLVEANPAGSTPLIIGIIAVIYNNSESSYFRLDMLWFVLLLVTMNFPVQTRRPAQPEPMDDVPSAAPA
jgi:O-antigen ligase